MPLHCLNDKVWVQPACDAFLPCGLPRTPPPAQVGEILEGGRRALCGIDILRKICNHPDLLERATGADAEDYGETGGRGEARVVRSACPACGTLRRVCFVEVAHPRGTPPPRPRAGNPSRSGKLQVAERVLCAWRAAGHKALLFCQTQQMLDIVERKVGGGLRGNAQSEAVRRQGWQAGALLGGGRPASRRTVLAVRTTIPCNAVAPSSDLLPADPVSPRWCRRTAGGTTAWTAAPPWPRARASSTTSTSTQRSSCSCSQPRFVCFEDRSNIVIDGRLCSGALAPEPR